MSLRYRFKTRPYKHQKEAIRKAIKLGSIALLMEPRTGKTKTAIDYLSILALAGKVDRAVIICPTRVMDVWVEEFYAHCPVHHHITVWDKTERSRGKLAPPRSGLYQLNVLLVNYEAFATPGRKLRSGRRSKANGRYAIRKQILGWLDGESAACVLDESHRIKSPSGKASTMVVGMAPRFDYRLILTGTPITKAKRAFDIWMQWEFLNPDRFAFLGTSTEFKNHYGKWTQRNGFPQFLGLRNEEDLRELVHLDAFAITRAECYDLPPKTEQVITVKLTTSGPVYDQLAEEMVAEVEDGGLTEASIPLVLTLRLSQITGGFAKTTDDRTVAVGTEKLDALEELLDDHLDNDEKVVICGRFRADLDAIVALCARKGIPTFEIRGGLSRHEVTENIAAFKRTHGVAAAVINPRAGGVGIDLSTAAHMIWYSLTPSWVDFTQCCDRIALSPSATTYTYLLAENTVDKLLYDTLQADDDIGKAILRDPRKVLRQRAAARGSRRSR